MCDYRCIIDELQGIEYIDEFNMEVIVDLLQSLVEIVTYGDTHDPSIFEFFMEHQVISDFVRVLEMTRNSRFQAKVLQYLSIMIQNLQFEHAIYYCLSNGYINMIIKHDYEFQDGDVVLYYVSLLRAVSAKLNRNTIYLLLEVQEGIVISFPLYTEAVKFAHHGEKMIQIAVRSITLSIYSVSDDMVYKFMVTPPVSEYFSDVINKLKKECVHLDAIVCAMGNHRILDMRCKLIDGTDKLLDHLFYIKDLLCVGKSCLSNLVTEKLLELLLLPIMMQLLQLGKSNGVNVSAITSLYFLSRLLQVIDQKEMFDFVAFQILYPHVELITSPTAKPDAVDDCNVNLSSEQFSNIDQLLCASVDPQISDKKKIFGHATLEHKISARHRIALRWDNLQGRNGIFTYILSDKLGSVLASLLLLLIMAGSDDLDTSLSSIFGFPQSCTEIDNAVVSEPPEQSIFVGCIPQILNVLLNFLESTPLSPVTQWHIGWFVLKLICLQRSTLNHQKIHLLNATFQLNALFQQARERLLAELGGCWLDYIPDTFEKEWTHCRTALEESSRNKDPFFALEIAIGQQFSDGNGIDAWEKMVDAVKIFVLHLQLKAYLLNGCLPGSPQSMFQRTSLISPSDSADSSVRFGSEASLASGIPCKITFSKLGLRDVYMVPMARGISGKLLLAEKHPFHSRRGIIFATAPLAGLAPKIDEEQATWLHLHVRDLTPNRSTKTSNPNLSGCSKDARWTLGFSDAKACEAASLLIAEETSKQRSIVEGLLAPYLSDNYPAD
ncbi:hypothetical protein RND81_01G027500 [Saponaria officinalis]|uniref:FPL domain-containing protein n=1 Tax=Saponaria officinalis TaxID=3572 RepID=A0AAW1NC82_SAPOF